MTVTTAEGSTTPTYDKTLPEITAGTEPYWNALREHRLIYQRCRECATTYAPYQPNCRNCWSTNVEDLVSTGCGTVYSFSIVWRPPFPAFRPDVPYAVAWVHLAEGFYVTTNIVNCAPDDVRIDMPVQVVFDDVTPQVTLARFAPSATE
jgi:uncharacterized OB-fold protein